MSSPGSLSVLDDFSRLRVWERGGQRAPHKPLLVLLALGRWVQGDHGPHRFTDIEGPLRSLLIEFGPPRRSHHPEFPFWYLRNDSIWQVTPTKGYPPRKGQSSPSAKQLRDADAVGEFGPSVQAALLNDPALVAAIATALLEAHFELSMFEDIAAAVGLNLGPLMPAKTVRDRAFRDSVLMTYRKSCAVCRVSVRLGDSIVGMEAAHIRWHASGGPDDVTNGLALCSLHHKLFDRGALTLSPDGKRIWVSELANGRNVERVLGRFHNRLVARPNQTESSPAQGFVAWHHKEVFQGRPRG